MRCKFPFFGVISDFRRAKKPKNLNISNRQIVILGLQFADLEEENVPENLPGPGTTKRRQYYYKQVADPFINGIPRPDQPCYLYAIAMVFILVCQFITLINRIF